jgi:hypothetical protein
MLLKAAQKDFIRTKIVDISMNGEVRSSKQVILE